MLNESWLIADATEIRAYHLVASSRLGDSSVLLLDSRGCPTGQVSLSVNSLFLIHNTLREGQTLVDFQTEIDHSSRYSRPSLMRNTKRGGRKHFTYLC